MARRTDTGLGTAGITNRSADGTPAVLRTPPRRGWQWLWSASTAEPDDALTDMTAPPDDAVELPPDGQYVHLRLNGVDGGAATVQLLFYPAEGAGWSETITFADAGLTATSLDVLSGTGGTELQNISAGVVRSIRGATKMAARITALDEDRQVQYRVF